VSTEFKSQAVLNAYEQSVLGPTREFCGARHVCDLFANLITWFILLQDIQYHLFRKPRCAMRARSTSYGHFFAATLGNQRIHRPFISCPIFQLPYYSEKEQKDPSALIYAT